jgi:hypothetical protein
MATWRPDRSGYEGEDSGPSVGEWLYCLKKTAPGDRQAIWSGIHGKGIIAVVDFSGDVRPRTANAHANASRRLYEGWGLTTPLDHPIDVVTARTHPVLCRRFAGKGAKALIGPLSLERDVAEAIEQCAGGLPPPATFQAHPADWDQLGLNWSGERLPPERIVEEIVANKARVARKLGFRSAVVAQKHLANGRRPDLWCDAGVVGDAKNQVTAAWGPQQIEEYIDQCDRQWPAHRWRGVLVQGIPEMAPNALPRLMSSRHADRIEVWAITRRRSVGRKLQRLFPLG